MQTNLGDFNIEKIMISFKPAIIFLFISILWLVTAYTYLFFQIGTTSAAGGVWTQQTGSGSRPWSSLDMSADGTKLIAADSSSGYIYTSVDSGVTWAQRTSPGFNYWRVSISADGTKMIAGNAGTTFDGGCFCFHNGYIWTSSDDGATWTQRYGGTQSWTVTSSANGSKLAAADYGSGSGGYIYTSTDGGVTWTQQTGSGARNWGNITSSADGTKLAAFESSGFIYTSTDSGVTWTQRTGAGSHGWVPIDSSADGSTLVTCYNTEPSDIYISSDGGATWTLRPNPNSAAALCNGASISSDGTKIAVAYSSVNGNIWTSTDSGATWTAQTSAPTGSFLKIAMSSDGSKMAATRDYIYTNSDCGGAGSGCGSGGGSGSTPAMLWMEF